MKRFFFQSYISFKALFGWLNLEAYLLIKIINPLLQILFFSILSKYVFQTDNIAPWIIGNSILLSTKNAIYGVGKVLVDERNMGTLKLIVASPGSNFLIFAGRGFMHIFDALITVTVGLLVGFLFFDFSIAMSNLFLFAVAILISLYSAMAIGQVISCLGLVYRDIHMLLNVSEYLLIILTGASFPISRLPLFLQGFSRFLPVTRGVEAARMLTSQYDLIVLLKLLMQEFLIGSLYLFAGYFSFKLLENLSRRKASLDMY